MSEKAGVEKIAELLMENPDFIGKLTERKDGSYSMAFAVETIQRQGREIKILRKELASQGKRLIEMQQQLNGFDVGIESQEKKINQLTSQILATENDVERIEKRLCNSGEWASKTDGRIKKLEEKK